MKTPAIGLFKKKTQQQRRVLLLVSEGSIYLARTTDKDLRGVGLCASVDEKEDCFVNIELVTVFSECNSGVLVVF